MTEDEQKLPYIFSGTVEHGQHLGHSLGMPTLNLYPQQIPALEKGVYFSQVELQGRKWPAITNLGVRPTVSEGRRFSVETYVYGLHQDVYGQQIAVTLVAFERPETRFASFEELKIQLQKDLEAGKAFFRL